jgi:biotin transport system substrate-specific component
MKRKYNLLSIRSVALIALFTALIAVGAFINVPVPFVPFTVQTMFVTTAGLILGSKAGALSTALYMGIGLAGLPIFAQGGGIGYIFKPSFGYIIGFIVGAFLTGLIIEKTKNKNLWVYIVAAISGLLVIYIFGCTYLYFIKNLYLGQSISLWNTLLFGFLVFVPGDIAMSVLGAVLAKRLKPILFRQIHASNSR